MTARILIVEDERIVAMDLQHSLEDLGYAVVGVVSRGDEAIRMAGSERPDVVLMDIHLDGAMDGTAAAKSIHDQYGTPIVFLTAYAEEGTLKRASASRPYGYLVKPFDGRELNATLRMALDHHHSDERQEQLTYLAFHDELTGLGNRHLLDDRLTMEVNRADRRGSRIAVFYLDLDDFKPVNDRAGHEAGDQLLRLFGERLRGGLRHVDTAVRFGGDEFVILAPDIAGEADCQVLAEKLHELVGMPFALEGRTVTVHASLGIAIYPDHAASAQDLLKCADQAMYLAKRRGGNRSVFVGDASLRSEG